MDQTISNDIRKTMTVEEAAAILGISRAKAYECARRGELPSLRFGRRIVVPAGALEQLLQGGQQDDSATSPKISDASSDAAAS